MKFKFAHQKVLEHRKRLENQAQADFFEARNFLLSLEEQLKQLFRSIQEARQRAYFLAVEGGSLSEELRQIHDFIKGTEFKIKRQHEIIRKALQVVEIRQEALRSAAVEYKIIDKLKANQLRDFKQAQRKLEIKRSDDLTMMRFKREEKE
jgi:flagellar FliJ protein